MHDLEGLAENFCEPGMQGGFAAHEIYGWCVLDARQEFGNKIIELHGFSRSPYRFIHILISKTVIAFQVTIAVQNDIHPTRWEIRYCFVGRMVYRQVPLYGSVLSAPARRNENRPHSE